MHNLHSTMLLLYPLYICNPIVKEYIYIPLCFYFIRCWFHRTPQTQSIYIPLCFYFIVVTSLYVSRCCHIYIPLCFYFITILRRNPSEWYGFTFHYASTLSDVWITRERSMLLFTFHYASTLSRTYYRIANIGYWFTFHYASTLSDKLTGEHSLKVNLHSTMLLLYPTVQNYTRTIQSHLHSTMLLLYPCIRPDVDGGMSVIYIPLCFYFILNCNFALRMQTLFTFHYASTLSKPISEFPARIFIYIPLCFYFIRNRRVYRLPCSHIYIPLCFYFIPLQLPSSPLL